VNNNVIVSLDSVASLCNIIQDSLDNNETEKAIEALNEIRREVLSMAYSIQTIRNQIKIAGKNLTEAFEKVIEPPKENADVG
jgi:two-component sensor histidine kinase